MKLKNYAAITDQGPYLQINEDGYEYDLENKLFMIFDGFGGSGVGDQAVANLKESIKTFYTRIADDVDATLPFYFSQKYLLEGNALINAMFYAHKVLCQSNVSLDMSKRGGASGLFASFSENILTLASVGNCVGYLYRKGILTKVMIEDSYKLLGQDDDTSPFQTMPLSAFGLFEDLNFQVKELRVVEGDLICLLSDGVYSRLKEQELTHILGSSDRDNSRKIEQMFEVSNSRGNLDNQTALVLQF